MSQPSCKDPVFNVCNPAGGGSGWEGGAGGKAELRAPSASSSRSPQKLLRCFDVCTSL